jgi:hypothetical protein
MGEHCLKFQNFQKNKFQRYRLDGRSIKKTQNNRPTLFQYGRTLLKIFQYGRALVKNSKILIFSKNECAPWKEKLSWKIYPILGFYLNYTVEFINYACLCAVIVTSYNHPPRPT